MRILNGRRFNATGFIDSGDATIEQDVILFTLGERQRRLD